MSAEDMPTPYEIARIAIYVIPNAAQQPTTAARMAIELWFAARKEIDNQKNRLNAEESNQQAVSAESEDNAEIILGYKEKNSPALEWCREHSSDKLDYFKQAAAFWKAWDKFEPKKLFIVRRRKPRTVTIAKLKEFLDWRKKQRREKNTKGRQLKRQSNKIAQGQEKKHQGRME